MNEHAELEQLRQRQRNLAAQVEELGRAITVLERRLPERPSPAPIPQSQPKPSVPPVEPRRVIPPPIPVMAAVSTPQPQEAPPPKAPPILPSAAQPHAQQSERKAEGFEMRLGTYWLVRIGLVMLLTAFVFFAYYAYEHYIPRLGPAAKLTLLYLGSGVLLSAGAWCSRRAGKETLRNYGQVLFAGGLAAVYFTTYAAHHVPAVRVISSALIDGILLLAWAGVIVWLADRQKSEVLALFAIGLAYYTSAITHIGFFTLYSNFVLSAAAVWFLIRHRWARVSAIALVATYAGYFLWSFVFRPSFGQPRFVQHFWESNLFVFSYWLLFTVAVFLRKGQTLADRERAGFLSANNAAFFGLVTLALLQVHKDWFWAFALGLGAALIGLYVLARRALPGELRTQNSYLTQGLLLVTVGLIAKFSGLHLALLLAAQSVALLVLGTLQQNRIMRIGAHLVAALVCLFAIEDMAAGQTGEWLAGAAVGLFIAFNAWWTARRDERPKPLCRPMPTYFAAIALIIWIATTAVHCSRVALPLILAAETVALTVIYYRLRLREMLVLGQSALICGIAIWLVQSWWIERPHWWSAVVLLGIALAAHHWWQRQRVLSADETLRRVWEGAYALACVAILAAWAQPSLAPKVWMAAAAGLALAVTAYAILMRAWLLLAAAQFFMAAAAVEFAQLHVTGQPGRLLALAPIAALAMLSGVTALWLRRGVTTASADAIRSVAIVYRWVAVLLMLWWVHEYVGARERTWVFVLLGLAAFGWAGSLRAAEPLLVAAAFSIAGLGSLWLPVHGQATVYLPNLLAVLAVLAQQHAARKNAERFKVPEPVHMPIIMIGGFSLWILLSRWVLLQSGGFYLTVSWSLLALALFVTGLLLRERAYRWLGLGILACALARVIVVDVWKLEVIYRVASFAALGVVLLLLGFLYGKYLERIRQWL